MASSTPAFRFYIDWLNDGDFSDLYDDVTSRPGANVLAGDGLTVTYGRDQARALSPAQPGAAAFNLANTSRQYSPENTGSPLYGQLVPGRPVKVTAAQDGATYTLYRGFLDDFTVTPNKGDRSLSVSCLDALARFTQANPLSTSLLFSIRTGTAVSAILDQLGWPAAARDLDVGATTIRWWWEEGTDGLTALAKVLAAEGPPAICYIDGQTGNFVYRDRHHRLLRPASVTSQATFTNGAAPESGTPYDTLVAAAAPVAWWQLDDPAGSGTAADSSAGGHPATATGMTFGNTSAAVTGNTSASLLAANAPKILTAYNPPFAAGITAEAWVNYNSQSQGANSPRLIANSHTDVDHNGFQLMVSNSGQPQFWVGNGTSAGNAAGGAVPASGWTYLAGTYDGANVRIYVNGTLATTTGFSGTVTAGSATGIGLGYNPAYNGDYLSGLLAECAVYGTVASAAQIAARYQATPVTVTYSQPMTYDFGWRDIVNTIVLSADQRDLLDVAPVWQSDATITVPNGGTVNVAVQASDPFTSAAVPVAGTDFTVLSGAVTVSLSRTSGQSATITLTDTAGGTTITGLQLQAQSAAVTRTVQVNAADPVSAGAYGVRGLPGGVDPSWACPEDAAAIEAIYLARYAQRRPIVTIPVSNLNAGRLAQQLTRDLGDRIHITDTETGLDDDFFIEQISHATSGTGRVLTTTFGCEKAPVSAVAPLTFDTSGRGFDQGTFGAPGLDDPTTVFIFDDATRGKFDVGVLGT